MDPPLNKCWRWRTIWHLWHLLTHPPISVEGGSQFDTYDTYDTYLPPAQ